MIFTSTSTKAMGVFSPLGVTHASRGDISQVPCVLYSMLISSDYFCRRKKCHKKRKCWWNLHCKDLHSEARHRFPVWHNNDRLRTGVTFEAMRTSHARFKRTVMFCKNNENLLKKEILLSKFISKNPKNFGKKLEGLKAA